MFDPTNFETQNVRNKEKSTQLELGGRGIFLVKKVMDSMIYERKDNLNVLVMTKEIGSD